MPEPTGNKSKKIVMCPECDAEVEIDEVDECPKCGLNVQRVIDKDRYDRALENLRKRREEESNKGKKKKNGATDWL
jgi:hypothetical protein